MTLPLRNTETRWGWISIVLHWGVAVVVFGLFGLGLWMTELGYYDAWYKKGPDLHRAVGILLGLALIGRLLWRMWDGTPKAIANHTPWERRGAAIAHRLLYGLLFAIMISGYLISTADGRAISVFGYFDVPATLTYAKQQTAIAGPVHFGLAIALIVLAIAHAAAAIKHHLIDKDETLKRMLGR